MERRIEFMVVLLIVAVAQSAGARLLDDDLSYQKNSISFDPKLSTVLENRDPPVTLSDGVSANSLHQNAITTEILQNEGVPLDQKQHANLLNELPSGPSPGVGHMASNTNSHIERAEQKSPAAFHILPSDPSPGGGHSFPDVQGTTLNKLPSGSSPGGGHSVPNSQVNKIGVKEESVTLNKLPSGPSPGGGNSIPNSHVDKTAVKEESVILNKLPSGPSPGGGHSFPNSQVDKMGVKEESVSLNKLSSGPSPGGGHSVPNSQVDKIGIKDESVKLNKLPSGPSPGGGHSIPNSQVDKVGVEERTVTLNKLPSGPSPGGGHSISNSQVDKVRVEERTVTLNKLLSGPSPGGGHSIPNSQVDKVEVEERTVTLNKLPSGPSPGSGNSHVESVEMDSGKSLGVGEQQTYSLHAEKQNVNAGKERSSSIRPQSGPSPGVGHGFKADNAQKSTHAAVTNVPLGSIKASSTSGPRIGCANGMEGVGQASRSIKVFDDSSYYGAPNSAMFGIAGIDSQS